MLKFLRHIRYKLFTENKISRYFSYAIGEIALVVLGILIALQINNWNEYRKDRLQEQKILLEFQDFFEANIAQLEQKISVRKLIISNARDAITYIDLKKEVPLDSFIIKLAGLIATPTFDPVNNGLLTTENLQLIRNDSLRHYLSNFTSRVADIKESEDEYILLYLNTMVDFFIDLGIARDVHRAYYLVPENLYYLKDEAVAQEIMIQKSQNTPSVKSLLNNRKLEGIIAQALTQNISNNWASVEYKNEMLTYLEIIRREMNEE